MIAATDDQIGYMWEGVFDVVTDPSTAGRVCVAVYGEGRGLCRSDDAGRTGDKLYDNSFRRGVVLSLRHDGLAVRRPHRYLHRRHPHALAWSPGTGVRIADVPFAIGRCGLCVGEAGHLDLEGYVGKMAAAVLMGGFGSSRLMGSTIEPLVLTALVPFTSVIHDTLAT